MMYERSALVAGVALMLGISPALADVKAGVDAWQQGDYRKAVEEWRGPAVAGDADAQFNLGQAYKLGRGVPVDLGLAEEWYRKAAAQGHVQASDNYGLALFQNHKFGEAVPWLEKSAARGEPRAQLVLGTMLFNGDGGLPRDWPRAYALLTRSSASGLPQGSQTLGQMDKYISDEDRQKGMALARQYELAEQKPQLPPEITGGGSGSGMRGTELPPSSYAADHPGETPRQPVKTGKGRGKTAAPVQVADAGPPPPARPEQPRIDAMASQGVASDPAPDAQAQPRPMPAGRDPLPPAPPTAAQMAKSTAQRTPSPQPVRAPAGRGMRLQFGAFRDEGNARNLWETLKARVPGLRGLQPYLVRAGAITKLQAGPIASSAEAAHLCAAVRPTGNACVSVTP